MIVPSPICHWAHRVNGPSCGWRCVHTCERLPTARRRLASPLVLVKPWRTSRMCVCSLPQQGCSPPVTEEAPRRLLLRGKGGSYFVHSPWCSMVLSGGQCGSPLQNVRLPSVEESERHADARGGRLQLNGRPRRLLEKVTASFYVLYLQHGCRTRPMDCARLLTWPVRSRDRVASPPCTIPLAALQLPAAVTFD